MKLRRKGGDVHELNVAVRNRDVRILFSYETPVACFIAGVGYFRAAGSHSRTTSKHITQWLDGVPCREVTAGIIARLPDSLPEFVAMGRMAD